MGSEPEKTAPVAQAPKAADAPKAPEPAPKAAATPAPAPSPALQPAPQAAPKFELPAAIYSPALLESVIYDLQFYLDWVHQNQIRKSVGAKAKEEPSHSAETIIVINAWTGGKPATVDGLAKLLEHLKGLKLPEIHLMLAALPNRTQREALADWFRNNVSPQLLVSFVADRNLGGGVVVRTPNHVYDLTWKQQLVAGRSKIVEILKSV